MPCRLVSAYVDKRPGLLCTMDRAMKHVLLVLGAAAV